MASPANTREATGPVLASTSIPFVYRLILTTIEPFFAVSGAVLAFRDPGGYLATMTRASVSFASETRFLYTELGGGWLYFAFTEAVVFRIFDDLRLWRVLCCGMLLSDFAYCHSAAQAVGGWGAWFNLRLWGSEDWLVFFTTAPMVMARMLIVFGIGVKSPAHTKK